MAPRIEVTKAALNATYAPLPQAGTLAAMPANGAVRDGGTYLADQNGGTPYQMVNGVWTQQAAGVTAASGQMVAGPVALTSAFNVLAVGTTQTDIPGMSLAVPASARPVLLRFKGEGTINVGTAATGSLLTIWLIITDAANTFKAMSLVSKTSTGAALNQPYEIVVEYYIPAPVAATTYKLRAQLGGAAPSGSTVANVSPNAGIVGGANNFYAIAA